MGRQRVREECDSGVTDDKVVGEAEMRIEDDSRVEVGRCKRVSGALSARVRSTAMDLLFATAGDRCQCEDGLACTLGLIVVRQ